MKKLVLAVILVFVAGLAMAQDVIVLRDGSTILSKVEEVSETEIKFKKWSNMDGPLYSMKTSAVMSINYQNGEMDKFSVKPEEKDPEPKNTNVKEGKMERKGKNLTLDGRVLTDKEVKKLIGEQDYKTYIGARKQIAAGNTFGGILALSVIAGATSYGVYQYVAPKPAAKTVFIASSALAFTSLSLMCVFKGIGGGRLGWVAGQYNQPEEETSFLISPSMMNDDLGNVGFGLTLSLNF